ncbi:hypothetical protein [Agromyces sp. NPDC049794]|uniref:hypothetical protein n=1 Tax=unclassified Agromyces TaxID=2639701 RepID=UPI0033D6EFEA
MSDRPPELDGEPHDDGPVYGERRRRALRIAVLVALGALVLPVLLSVYGVAHSAAQRACAVSVRAYDTDAAGARVAFDLFGPAGPGWACFAVGANGSETLVAELGLLPGAPRVPGDDERNT